MSSRWHSIAEAWLRGTATVQDLVVTAAIEGQLTALEHFFREHPPSLSQEPLRRQTLNSFVCYCVYDLLSRNALEHAIQVIQRIRGDVSLDQWLRDTLMLSTDAAVRDRVVEYLGRNRQLNEDDATTIRDLRTIKRIYAVESYPATLERYKSYAHMSFQPNAWTQLEAALNALIQGPSLRIADEVRGLIVPDASESVWGRLEWNSEWDMFSQRSRSSRSERGMERLLALSPLFFKGAAEWFRFMSEDCRNRILVEGELLTIYLNKTAVGVLEPWEDQDAKWRADVQYYVSRDLIEETLERLNDIPVSNIMTAPLSIVQNGVEILQFDGQLLDFDIRSLSTCWSKTKLENKLLSKGIWPQSRWDSLEDWIRLLSRTDVLFGPSSVNDAVHEILRQANVVYLVTDFCIQNDLQNLLQVYLERHVMPVDLDQTLAMLKLAAECDWAQWLILSCIPQQSFAATLANAKYVLAKEDPGISVKSLSDLVQADSKYVLLTALAHSPRPLQQTLLLEYPVMAESPSSRKELRIEDGVICPVDPVCCISDILPPLQEHFPETCQALEQIAREEKEQGNLTSSEFSNWRNRLLRIELGDVGFRDMVMTSGIEQIERLLEMSQHHKRLDSDSGQKESAQYWEEAHMSQIEQWLDKICHQDIPGGVSIGVCRHLICGRPIAALQWFLATKNLHTSSAMTQEDKSFLELLARLVALWNYKEPCIIFSAMIFACACGIDTTKIKIDIVALQRLESVSAYAAEIPPLLEDLTAEVALEYDDRYRFQITGQVSKRVLALLENAILNSCSFQPLTSSSTQIDSESPSTISESTDAVLKWSLVHAFAKLHKHIPSKRLLEKLAQADDWILFLVEASFFPSTMQEVICVAKTQFTDPNLGHHVCFILEGSHELQKEPSSLTSMTLAAASQDLDAKSTPIGNFPASEEFFDVLNEAERTGRPIQALLLWARRLRWRLLTVMAACYSPLARLESLIVWLDIGASTSALSRQASRVMRVKWVSEFSREQLIDELMQLVYRLCYAEQYDELTRGLALFQVVPFLSMQHFLSALKNYHLHMFNTIRPYLSAFEETLEKEIKKFNSTRDSLSTSTSSNVNALIASHLDLELVDKITQSAVMATLRRLSTAFEREKLLGMIVRMEADYVLSWLPPLRTVHRIYMLLGPDSENSLDWDTQTHDLPAFNAAEISRELQKAGRWKDASEWAADHQLPFEEITLHQVRSLVAEWTEFNLGDDLDDILWEQVNQIFLELEYPPLKSGLFFVQQAQQTQPDKRKHLLLEALHWVDGTRIRSLDQAPRLIAELTRALYLMDTDGDIIQKITNNKGSVAIGSRTDKCPAMQMVLRPVLDAAFLHTVSEISRSSEVSTGSSPTFDRENTRQTLPRAGGPMSNEEQHCLAILEEIVPQASEAQVQGAIKLLLDNGQIDAAESLHQREKLGPQIEFFLVNTALNIVHKCTSNGWNGEVVEKIVFPSILSFLKQRHYLIETAEAKPQEVLDAVAEACRDCGGYPVCARAAVAFRTASLLHMSCVELANEGPNKALELLLLKGDEASEVVQEFVRAFEFSPRATANKLAQMYLKSLMGSRGISSINENEPVEDYETKKTRDTGSDLIDNSAICSDPVELGNELMQLLVERHCVLTAEIEADILVQSYECYRRMNYVEGLDVLLDLVSSRVRNFAADEKYDAMIRLTVGICRFDGLSSALDVIIQKKKLDLLFQDANSHNPATINTLRAAILSSIYRHSPKDSQTLNVTYRHFNMHVEVGQGIKDKAMDLLEQYTSAGRSMRDQKLMKAMDLFIRAAAEFSCAQCSASAAVCGDFVALVAQQICHPERRWVCLSDAECRALLPKLSDINSALILSRAYKFNTPQDWILTLWQHMLYIAGEHRHTRRSSASLTRTLQTMFDYSSGIMKEITFSDNHLEQILQMYMAFPMDEATSEQSVNYSVLAQCVVQFLHSISDVRKRLSLSSMMDQSVALPLMQECKSLLDQQTV